MDNTPSTPKHSSSVGVHLPTLSPGTKEFMARHNLNPELLDDDDDDDSFDPSLLASASRNALVNARRSNSNSHSGSFNSSRDHQDSKDNHSISSNVNNSANNNNENQNVNNFNRPIVDLPRRATPPDFKRSSSSSLTRQSNLDHIAKTPSTSKDMSNLPSSIDNLNSSSASRPLRLLPETPNILPSSSTNNRTSASTVRRRRPAAGTQRPDKKWTPAMIQMLQGGNNEDEYDGGEGSNSSAQVSTSYNTPHSNESTSSPKFISERPILNRNLASSSSYGSYGSDNQNSSGSFRNTPPSISRSNRYLESDEALSQAQENARKEIQKRDDEKRRRDDDEANYRKQQQEEEQIRREQQEQLRKDRERREREREKEKDRERERDRELQIQREREREREEVEAKARAQAQAQIEKEQQEKQETMRRQASLHKAQAQSAPLAQPDADYEYPPPLTDAIVPLQPPSYVPPPAPAPHISWPQPGMYMRPPSYISVNGVPYMRLDELGKGGSSKVFRVLSGQNELSAIKRVRLDKCDPETVTGYLNEISLLQRLRGNDRIIKLYDWERTGGKLVMRMECGEIDFARLLHEQQGKRLNMNFVGMYWEQMLRAVHAIHEEAIVHSDLKPANFVLVKGSLKLIDFGIAKAIPNDTNNIQRDSQVGTINYMSPEAITNPTGLGNKRGLKLGRPSDVWSLGCILYQMIYSHPPFYHYQNLHKKLSVIPDPNVLIDFPTYSIPVEQPMRTSSGTYEPVHRQDLAVKVDQDVLKTMKSCLNRDSKKRMTIPELLDVDPFLQPRSSQASQKSPPKQNTLTINPAQMNQLVKQVIQFGKSQSNNPSVLKTETVQGVTQALWKTLGDAQN